MPTQPTRSDLRTPGAILLVSCYELGHQPLGLALAVSRLKNAGFSPALMDIAAQPVDVERVRVARLIAISTPMHTAARLGVAFARRAREMNSLACIVFYGIYAALNSDFLLREVADACVGAEYEAGLVKLAEELSSCGRIPESSRLPDVSGEFAAARRDRAAGHIPHRSGLPSFDRYVKLLADGRQYPVASVATTRGCKHGCLHCPVPAVYRKAFYAHPVDAVMEDIGQVVTAGVRHISFADPDFLNGPEHARRIVRSLSERFPGLTFDFTAKVEHLLSHKELVPEFRDAGCRFVVTAIETLSDRTLRILHKGHSSSDAIAVIRLLRHAGLTLRPSFVPFTPWDTYDDYVCLLETIEREALIDVVDPVQLGIRLLVPPGSLLLASPKMQPHLSAIDHEQLTYAWRHPDPRMDELQRGVMKIVEADGSQSVDPAVTFFRIRSTTLRYRDPAAAAPDPDEIEKRFPRNRTKPPRLSEDWFC